MCRFQSNVPQSVLLVCSFILPPLAVLFRTGCSVHFLLNLLLSCIGYVPGIIHAIYVCFYARNIPDYNELI
uniref:UPF0057-domain-containing protein n=1 Tax=Panagrellus redivivus TaxID=6233 RepID=A0A7E4W8A8_PANRE